MIHHVLPQRLRWGLGLLLVLWSTAALAYQYEETPLTGEPLHWPMGASFEVVLDPSVPDAIEGGSPADVIEEAFAQWLDLSCSSLVLEGISWSDEPLGVEEVDGINAIIWVFDQDAWDANPNHEAWHVAGTTFHFNPYTGELVEADIEINGAYHDFAAATPVPEGFQDLSNAMVHEVGHLLGMGHSQDEEATMYGSAGDGETIKRDLDEDDILGFCAMYEALPPPLDVVDETATGVDTIQDEGAFAEVSPEVEDDDGEPPSCAATPSRGAGGSAGLALAFIILLAFIALPLRSRRPRTTTSTTPTSR